MTKKFLMSFIVLVMSAVPIHPAETGKPFMTLYTAKETGGHFQNWAIAQDNRGVIYIGNGFGVQEFDGSTWRIIASPNRSSARCFAKDSTGRIYVGSLANFGYLAADRQGSMHYVSLINYLTPEDQAFNYIRTVQATAQGIYFQAQDILFRFHPKTTKDGSEDWEVNVWRSEGNFSYTFLIDQILYVQQVGVGLMKMVDDSLTLVPGSQQFSNDRIQILLPFPGKSGTFLLGTYRRGLFTWDGNSFQPFPTDSDHFLLDGPLYYGLVTPDSCFALGSTSTGFFIIDIHGRTKLHLTKDSGFTSNTVTCLYLDTQNNIWVGMDGGIVLLEYGTPLALFNVAPGSGANDFYRYKGVLYAATNAGVYYLDRADSKFKYVSGIAGNAQAFYFSEINNELYVPTGAGIYRLEGNKARLALQSDALSVAFNCLARSQQDSTIVFGGMLNGLGLLRYNPDSPDRLNFIGRVPGIHEYISRNVVEIEPGVIWPSTIDVGAICVKFDTNDFFNPKIERFGSEKGLPIGSVTVYKLFNNLKYVTKQGVYQFIAEEDTFTSDSLFDGIDLGRNPNDGMVVVDADSNIWVNLGKESALLQKQADGTFELHKDELARFSDEPTTTIYPEKNGDVWFGTSDYAIRYTPSKLSAQKLPFPALIRCVSLANDSIIYHGTQRANSFSDGSDERIFPYRYNSLRFDFSASSYLNPRANEFRTQLEGFDQNWSAWSAETRRNYTNLSAGHYRFRVKARNIYDQESLEAIYAFTILNPWYSTWWAYLCYSLLAIGFIIGLVRLRTNQLQKRSRTLERVVQERTAEIQEQKNNVERLSRIGQDITDNLSIKEIISTVYENVNNLMDASVFGIGLYHSDRQVLIFPATKEKGETLHEYIIPLADENSLAVWCYLHQQDLIICDYQQEYDRYIQTIQPEATRELPNSILYLPLQHKENKIGVITAQSARKNAYTEYHLNILRNLATYSAIALENAHAYRRLNELLDDLKATQEKLVTQSKLAALGALTAGIAHEIKNPLNFVNNFAELSLGLVDDIQRQLDSFKQYLSSEMVMEIGDLFATLKQNMARIQEHGKRADSIVRNMLQHSRGKAGERQLTDINHLLDEDISLAYHGMRAQDSAFNIKIEKVFDESIGQLEVVPQDISRVFLNIISNGCYEAHRKKIEQDAGFSPMLIVTSKNCGDQIEIRIRDNGNGIPPSVQGKLFNPFFTTKPSGQGTGLGLSISYDIVVHGHNGQILFETKEGEFAEFIIRLPRNK